MSQRSTPKTVLGLFLCTLLAFAVSASAAERKVKFKNDLGPGHNANDLHFKTSIPSTIKSKTPFMNESTPKTGKDHDLYGTTIPPGGEVEVVIESAGAPLEIVEWWWTWGGNYKRAGVRLGLKRNDPEKRLALAAHGGPATGGGIIRVEVGGQSADFPTLPGSTAADTLAQFEAFLTQFDDGGFALVDSAELGPHHLSFASNLFSGDPATYEPLRAEVLSPDPSLELLVLATPTAEAGFGFDLTGSCPGTMTASAFGATAGGPVTFFTGVTPGPAPSPCGGQLDIADGQPLVTLTADGGGDVSFTFPVAVCGDEMVQAVDEGSCESSNVAGY